MNQSVPRDYWEVLGETTRWGKYLAEREGGIIRRGLDLAGPPGKAVDLGCGGGRWGKMLADRGWEMTCVDVNEGALRACQSKMPSAECIRVDPSTKEIPCATASKRLMLCMEAPDVVEPAWFAPEASRVLQASGHLIGFYMNPNSWRGLIWRPKRDRPDEGIRHYTGPAYHLWRRDLAAHGFEMLHEESCAWPPFGRASDSPLVPLATTLELVLGLRKILRWAPWVLFVAQKRRA